MIAVASDRDLWDLLPCIDGTARGDPRNGELEYLEPLGVLRERDPPFRFGLGCHRIVHKAVDFKAEGGKSPTRYNCLSLRREYPVEVHIAMGAVHVTVFA